MMSKRTVLNRSHSIDSRIMRVVSSSRRLMKWMLDFEGAVMARIPRLISSMGHFRGHESTPGPKW